ncbi:MAG: P-type conjugative transfer protein TrbG [Rhodospirillaceae bacterium]|nr:P-type conjugative transfer protein TrbG [Rhodospirillaceae bacterium]
MHAKFCFIASVSVLALAACTTKPAPPPAITYDGASFSPAAMQVDPAPAEPAAGSPPEPVQIALPPPATPDTRPPTARVAAANKAALQEPTTHGYINAVQMYQFMDGSIYRLYAAPEQVSDIALQPGETLVSVSAGDTVRWVIGDTASGSGDDRRVHVLVKPFAPNLKSNLVITTDRRSYHLQLDSTESTAMTMVSWTYPQDQVAAMRKRAADVEIKGAAETKISLENVKFRYAISGDSPPWKPARAFDDGSKVYIEFPARIDQGEAPPLFVVGQEGNSELVNYRVRGNYYIVDRLFAAAELRLGQKSQQVVRISRTDGTPVAAR